VSTPLFSDDLHGFLVKVSYDAALWGLYVTKSGEWTWLEDGLVQLAISYGEAKHILCLTGMIAPGAVELVNALELGVFEAERRNGELEDPQNRLQSTLEGK
jgi:hypothetical protein